MHSRSDNLEIMTGKETDEVIKELSKPFFLDIKYTLKNPRKAAIFMFDSADLFYCKCHKIFKLFELRWIVYRFSQLDKKQKSCNKAQKIMMDVFKIL